MTQTTPTHPNAQQDEYWNQAAGPLWVRQQERLDSQIEPHGLVAIERAALHPGEHVVDIGCGCGQTSLELARRVGATGRVEGVDLSAPMLERARERAREAELDQLSFTRGDAQSHAFAPRSTDLFFSRFGVMFFEDPLTAFRNFHRALRPGGRITFLCWKGIEANPWMRIPMVAIAPLVELPEPPPPGAPGPLAFADDARVRGLLEEAGFEDVHATGHDSEMKLAGTGGPEAAAEFMLEIGPAARAAREAGLDDPTPLRDAIARALAPHQRGDAIVIGAGMWIYQARRGS
jgi:SAM-dependent methyltransferase